MPKKNLKIAVVGPVTPFRGGIAQYTEALHHSLINVSDVSVFSFKRLYPSLLYPGKSDKSAGNDNTDQANIHRMLDIYSPITWRRTADALIDGEFSAVIISWWTIIWKPAFAYIAWRLRKKNAKIIFLCHNVVDHDANIIEKYLNNISIKACNNYIVHTSEEARKIECFANRPKIMCRPHPIYNHFPKPRKRLCKRGSLEILYFGFIRPYKGIEVLIDAMKQLGDQDVHLTIVGEVWGEQTKEALLDNIRHTNANIETRFSYISESEAADYFGRADVVVLPYRSATGSGVATLAYHYGLPVIATAVGGLPDVVQPGKTGWLVEPNDPTALADTIKSVNRVSAKSMQQEIKAFCHNHSWDRMALAIVDFIGDLESKL